MRILVAIEMPTEQYFGSESYTWTRQCKCKRWRYDSRHASCLFTTMKQPLIRQRKNQGIVDERAARSSGRSLITKLYISLCVTGTEINSDVPISCDY